MAEIKAEFNQALNCVARWLAIRDHSRFELKQKLNRRFDENLSDEVLAEAESRGWLGSEEAIAERLASSLSRRGKSHSYISAQLKKRKLPVPAADEERELEKARALLRKKFGEEQLCYEDKAKAYRFLKYRGFDDRWIRKALE